MNAFPSAVHSGPSYPSDVSRVNAPRSISYLQMSVASSAMRTRIDFPSGESRGAA